MVDLLTPEVRMTQLIIKVSVVFSTLNCFSSSAYGIPNSTFTEYIKREIRSSAFIENTQDFQGSVVFNTHFSSCASSCSENDAECLGRCSNQFHGDRLHPHPPGRDVSRIVGGVRANQVEIPSMVALMRYGSPECGASIINKDYVLTAAHCFDAFGTSPGIYKILAGTLDKFDNQAPKTTVYGISEVILHENYTPKPRPLNGQPYGVRLGYDIALLRTSTPITIIPGYVEPAEIPKPGDDYCGNATIWGWGYVIPDDRYSSSRYLLKVDVPEVPYETCVQNYVNRYNISNESQICYGFKAGKKDSCQGDSGGPLTCSSREPYFQIGIVSYGQGCAEANHPGIYTRVAKFQNWIRQKVNGIGRFS